MTWTAQSAFFDYLMSGEDAWDRLVARHPAFDKFARVLLDEARAGRVDMADVARMVGVDLAALLALANGESGDGPLPDGNWPLPEIGCGCRARAANGTSLDLRPVFERGEEPLCLILDAADATAEGDTLTVTAPFHPVPLRRLLAGRGFASLAKDLADGAWEVVFQRGFGTSELRA
ncbi:MAG: hypothetical protein BroJett029_06220 [Alphaproteobacteria bacterium]|nr:MAG: hypothetical protein BroJett029_06220 [Alphaproteobacteria bacterium]